MNIYSALKSLLLNLKLNIIQLFSSLEIKPVKIKYVNLNIKSSKNRFKLPKVLDIVFYTHINNRFYILLNNWFNLTYISIKSYYNTIYKYIRSFFTSLFNTNMNSFYAFLFILFIDGCLTDDEPLWEPIEWSLVQSWILFLFFFAWIFENLISSRYGSYVGKDKRVWLGWYKTFWLVEIFYALNYGAAMLFVITPYYGEIRFTMFYIYSWWNVFSRTFMFKFIFIFFLTWLVGLYVQINCRWINWKKGLLLILTITFVIAYVLFTQFVIILFGYFTSPYWYNQSRSVDYILASHEPNKWSHGVKARDPFTHHAVRSNFWFKYDAPFVGSLLIFNYFFTLNLFFLFIYWVALFRRVYLTREIPLTFTTYCVNTLRHFLYSFLLFYFMIFISFFIQYLRLPFEYSYLSDNRYWISNLIDIIFEYPYFILHLIF